MQKAFGRFVPASRINELTAARSEWLALKSLLPAHWFHREDEIANSLLELRRRALHALDEAKQKPTDPTKR
jgi:hypothetical protein